MENADAASLPENGIGNAPPAASTPGSPASLGKICSKNCRCFSGSGILCLWQNQLNYGGLGRVKPGFGRAKIGERFDEQASAGQEQKRKRNLSNDQDTA